MTTHSPGISFRHASPAQLAEALTAARDYTLALFDALAAHGYDDAVNVPRIRTLNPPLWELGHTAWFAEWFVLREATSSHPAGAQKTGLLAKGDDWFDSALVAHASRWSLDLPAPGAVRTYTREVLDRIIDKLGRMPNDDAALYPFRLVLAHEDMHGEAFLYTLQKLGVAPRDPVPDCPRRVAGPAIAYPGGTITLGGMPPGGFRFDNEQPPQRCYVAPFEIDADAVSNGQFAEFVLDGGYEHPQFWTPAARAWLMGQERSAPRYWSRDGGAWTTMRFGQAQTLDPHEAVRHVSLFEAQAYCAWAGRRLPLESEWEYAATSSQPGFHWGAVWEWTATPFEPYPGFAPDRYLEYSAPWFGTHQVLRGASFATPARFRSPYFRNFFMPERDDLFGGFRTCAL
jgi:ergothioneine biosynthesis protein EgtB